MRKTRTAQEVDKAGKVPDVTDTVKTKIVVERVDRYIRLLEVMTMIDLALMKFEKKRNSQVSEMAKETVIGARGMCAVEAQDSPVRSTVSLAIQSVIGNIPGKEVVAGRLQRTAMRAVVHPSVVKAVFDALLKSDVLMAPITTFELN